jgi:hypothetical protein
VRLFCSLRLFSNDPNSSTGAHNSSYIDGVRNYEPLFNANLNNLKLVWLKIAIIEKSLTAIIDALQESSARFYTPEALMADASDAAILSSLVAGPCALEYTRFKTCDNLFTDQNADELIRRHKMHIYLLNSASNALTNASGYGMNGGDAVKQQPANSLIHFSPVKTSRIFASSQNAAVAATSATASGSSGSVSGAYNPKEYVESLHQNVKTQLIYGKNHTSINKVRTNSTICTRN